MSLKFISFNNIVTPLFIFLSLCHKFKTYYFFNVTRGENLIHSYEPLDEL